LRSARWLYVLTGDQEMVGLGSPCDSRREFELALRAVRERWSEVRAQYEGARQKALVLSLRGDEVAALRDGRRVVMRTAVARRPGGVRAGEAPAPAAEGSRYFLPDRKVWIYEQPRASSGAGSGPTFYLARSVVEDGGRSVLTGAWL